MADDAVVGTGSIATIDPDRAVAAHEPWTLDAHVRVSFGHRTPISPVDVAWDCSTA